MAIQGFCPPPSPSPPSPPSHSHSPYYQLLERGSARLGRVKNRMSEHIRISIQEIGYASNPLLCG